MFEYFLSKLLAYNENSCLKPVYPFFVAETN